MRTKELKELHTKTVDELKKMLAETRENLFHLQMDQKQMKLKNTRAVMMRRKDVARILTILRGKELAVKNG